MAAPEAVLLAVDGAFTHADSQPLLYNTDHPRQAGCLITNHGSCHQQICQAAATAMASIDLVVCL
jgi:3'(2'), 5'-bisphosphate nucleotidase